MNDIVNTGLTTGQSDKLNKLKDYITGLGSLAVGFSGGVDSSLLAYVAAEVLGDRAIAVSAADPSVPEREIKEAEEFCHRYGIRHIICHTNPFSEESYRHNLKDRCYFCKKGIFKEIMSIAADNGIEYVAEGSNMDDLGDYRPGLAAVEELGVVSPLREAGMTKEDIRMISRALSLPTWSKPAYACLASRFVYGEDITEEKLRMVDRAEQYLIERGFLQERVRIHGQMARIEVPASDIARIASDEYRQAIYDEFKKIGFLFVTLDLGGYRTGSMNSTIK